jgi:hypothetical protein
MVLDQPDPMPKRSKRPPLITWPRLVPLDRGQARAQPTGAGGHDLRRVVRKSGAAIMALVLAGCDTERSVWFAPNLASRDMVQLFTHPDEWRESRKDVGVFKFYAVQVGILDACAGCGENVLANFASAGAFEKLRRWGIATAVETSALKDWGCTAEATLPLTLRAIANVRNASGEVRFVAMDEPLLGGQDCGLSPAATATEVVRYAAGLRASVASVQVGDIEPYPRFDAARLVEWLDLLRAEGWSPSFFHLDVDRLHAARLGKNVPEDLAALQAACRARAVPFGVIFSGADGLDDAAYAADVRGWVDVVHAAIGRPEQIVFQSWAASADGRQEVPLNLPEGDPALWTHTRLLREGFARLRASR